jgi:dTDP-4-dehydrorhamnose reductase
MELITMHNLLITGVDGQVGNELRLLATEYAHNYFFANREVLDICDEQAVLNYITEHKITAIINTAAYTAVDKAEEEQAFANAINHLAVQNLSQIAKEKKITLIHLSTDYVFNGENFRPYVETDKTLAMSVYGESKRLGEEALLTINPKNSIIIRTSWVYSSFGANFVKTMLRLGQEREELGVIFDQIGTPTYAKDLAKNILDILPKIKNANVEIYHYSNEGVASWYDFAQEIMKRANLDCKINPIETKDYPTPAKRPIYALLNKAKIKKEFDLEIPYWKESLQKCIKIIGENKK